MKQWRGCTWKAEKYHFTTANKLLCVSVYINLPRNAKEQWKTCSQGRRRTQDPVSNSPMQITQSHSESWTWQVLRIAGWAIACDSAKSYHIAKARNLCLHLAVRVFILKTSKPVKLIWSWCWMPPATSCDTPAYFVASMSSIVPKHTSKGSTSFWNITPSWLSIWSSSSYWAPQCNLVFVSGYLQCLKTRPFDSGIPSPRASIQSWYIFVLQKNVVKVSNLTAKMQFSRDLPLFKTAAKSLKM